ncbi:MAG: type II toxin-antitoxin system RelE/ParE family toxin [Terracidiphilus sp.]|jgi:toxin ParE1/3/4
MPAANQLRNIFEFIAAGNPVAAYRTIRRIREAILLTVRMPSSGRAGRVDGTREITVSGTSYLVAYKIVDNLIHVLAILHGAQEWPESF